MRRHLAVHKRLLPGIGIALLALAIMPVSVNAAEQAITFGLTLRSSGECIFVNTAADTPTNVTLRSAAGEIKAQGTLAADEAFFCLDASTWVDSGDTLKASDGSNTRKFVAPNLSVEIDRVNNVYWGSGPAGRTLFLEYPGSLFGRRW